MYDARHTHRIADDVIQVTMERTLDRIQLDVIDDKSVFNMLKNMFVIRRDTRKRRKFYFKYSRDDDKPKFVYQFNTKSIGADMLSTIQIHDVSMCDQCFLMNDLLAGRTHWLDQIEYASSLYPIRREDFRDLFNVVSGDLTLIHSRIGAYNSIRTTQYWGLQGYVRPFRRGEKWVKPKKGIRLYIGPTRGPFQYVRVELQVNTEFIRKNDLKLPLFPTDFDPFQFIRYRQGLDHQQLFDYLIRREKRRRMRKGVGWPPILEVIIDDLVSGLNFPETETPYEDVTPVARQLSNFKELFPELKNRVSDFFPPTGKEAQLLEDIRQGFVRRNYE